MNQHWRLQFTEEELYAYDKTEKHVKAFIEMRSLLPLSFAEMTLRIDEFIFNTVYMYKKSIDKFFNGKFEDKPSEEALAYCKKNLIEVLTNDKIDDRLLANIPMTELINQDCFPNILYVIYSNFFIVYDKLVKPLDLDDDIPF